MFAGSEFGPGSGVHVVQYRRLPGIFLVIGQESCGIEIDPARMARPRDEIQRRSHLAVRYLAADGTGRIKRLRARHGVARIAMAAKRPAVGTYFLGERIE